MCALDLIFVGLFNTRTVVGRADNLQTEIYLKKHQFPINRLGYPDEFSRAVIDVIRSGYLNGTNVRLDGAGRIIFL